MADIPQVLATYDALVGVALGAGLTYGLGALNRRHQEAREDKTRWYQARLEAYKERNRGPPMAYGTSMGDDDDLLTAKEVARMLAVSLATFKRPRKAGEGPPSIRVGERAIRYRRGDVEAWLRRRPKK